MQKKEKSCERDVGHECDVRGEEEEEGGGG